MFALVKGMELFQIVNLKKLKKGNSTVVKNIKQKCNISSNKDIQLK
jgi:hypothetical protein